ncbi:hypothetical protein HYC85_005017 [Camellia sinensis]|uniref:ubiquitinyl hydrolase 1 n=1 Tax=Camellia sinensis TaxID=4442 RepID=A0A7J7HY73_CAMSI|nr:hypothetical protein HYC85_005017 [Camellia sinensis]
MSLLTYWRKSPMLQRVIQKLHHHLKWLQMAQLLFMPMVLKKSLLSLGCTKIFSCEAAVEGLVDSTFVFDVVSLARAESSDFSGLQEAQKRMKIKKPPHILVIHLKRFKYIEQLGRYKKLSYRVVFPLELKLSNTVEDADAEYSLFAVVVHVGSGPNHGHYVSLVKSHNHWLFFDDDNVEMIDESAVQTFFGSAQEYSSNTDHGYILFYERLAAGPTS